MVLSTAVLLLISFTLYPVCLQGKQKAKTLRFPLFAEFSRHCVKMLKKIRSLEWETNYQPSRKIHTLGLTSHNCPLVPSIGSSTRICDKYNINLVYFKGVI